MLLLGSWNGGVPVPRTSLDEFVTAIAPGKEKETFLTFVRKMLTWDPEVRETTNELIEDEWLMTPDVEVWVRAFYFVYYL